MSEEQLTLTREEREALAWAAGWMQLHADKALSDLRYNLLDSARVKLRASYGEPADRAQAA